MKKLVLFGAGNIGRSFVGQLFSRAGYEVVFIDIDTRLLTALNTEHRYRVVIKQTGRPDEIQWIDNVRALDGRDTESVAAEVASADIIATAVGQRALPIVIAAIARGLTLRRSHFGDLPLDIIIAENLHSAAEFFHTQLKTRLPADYPLDDLVGLVETSIGKMVPIMRTADLEEDPLWVFAEPYNRLILDKHAFKNPIPAVTGLAPMNNMKAYVNRKLYIHNLGHACAAYFGCQTDPTLNYIWQVLDIPAVFETTRRAMQLSADSLHREYSDDLTPAALTAHVDDLLDRFRNRALGDTVYRVGRDLYRKLAHSDRLVGAMLLAHKHNIDTPEIARAYLAATTFKAADENGALFPDDRRFHESESPHGLPHILKNVSSLSPDIPAEAALIDAVIKQSQQ